jgi:hypothetical protein
MNPTTLELLVAGGAVGFGATLLVAVLVPQRPDLVAALNAARTPAAPTGAVPSGPATAGAGWRIRLQSWQASIEAWLAATRLTAPESDLRVVGKSRGEFLLTRVGFAAAGLLIAPVYTLIFTAFHLGVPVAVPVIAGLIAAAVAWLAVGAHVTGKAAAARREMRHALVAYLQLVALHRAAGAGIGAALDQAATASDTWAFRRIAAAIASATRAGRTHWYGIANLADELGIQELADLSAIAASAGTTGAGVYTSLLARAGSLRAQLQADDTAAAAIASTRMAIPKALLAAATMAFLIYPAITALTAT